MIWSSKMIDSSKFYERSRHENPRTIKVSANNLVHKDVRTGQYLLSKGYMYIYNL